MIWQSNSTQHWLYDWMTGTEEIRFSCFFWHPDCHTLQVPKTMINASHMFSWSWGQPDFSAIFESTQGLARCNSLCTADCLDESAAILNSSQQERIMSDTAWRDKNTQLPVCSGRICRGRVPPCLRSAGAPVFRYIAGAQASLLHRAHEFRAASKKLPQSANEGTGTQRVGIGDCLPLAWLPVLRGDVLFQTSIRPPLTSLLHSCEHSRRSMESWLRRPKSGAGSTDVALRKAWRVFKRYKLNTGPGMCPRVFSVRHFESHSHSRKRFRRAHVLLCTRLSWRLRRVVMLPMRQNSLATPFGPFWDEDFRWASANNPPSRVMSMRAAKRFPGVSPQWRHTSPMGAVVSWTIVPAVFSSHSKNLSSMHDIKAAGFRLPCPKCVRMGGNRHWLPFRHMEHCGCVSTIASVQSFPCSLSSPLRELDCFSLFTWCMSWNSIWKLQEKEQASVHLSSPSLITISMLSYYVIVYTRTFVLTGIRPFFLRVPCVSEGWSKTVHDPITQHPWRDEYGNAPFARLCKWSWLGFLHRQISSDEEAGDENLSIHVNNDGGLLLVTLLESSDVVVARQRVLSLKICRLSSKDVIRSLHYHGCTSPNYL